MLLLVCAALALSGCGRVKFQRVPPTDAGMDASGDAATDAARDAPSADAGRDARTPDSGADASTDATVEAGADAEVDAGFDAGPPRDLDYCNEVPPLRRTAIIDGVLEPGLLLRALTPVGWTGAGSVPTGESSSYAVAWQPDGLYLFVRVVDPSRLPAPPSQPTWSGDGVELYVDADGAIENAPTYDANTIQICASAPSDDTTPVSRVQGFRNTAEVAPWSSNNFGAFPTSDGYVVEALVQAHDVMIPALTLASGARVGFDLSVNVSTPAFAADEDAGSQQTRIGQYFLRISDQLATCNGAPFCQPLAFCTPLLID